MRKIKINLVMVLAGFIFGCFTFYGILYMKDFLNDKKEEENICRVEEYISELIDRHLREKNDLEFTSEAYYIMGELFGSESLYQKSEEIDQRIYLEDIARGKDAMEKADYKNAVYFFRNALLREPDSENGVYSMMTNAVEELADTCIKEGDYFTAYHVFISAEERTADSYFLDRASQVRLSAKENFILNTDKTMKNNEE